MPKKTPSSLRRSVYPALPHPHSPFIVKVLRHNPLVFGLVNSRSKRTWTEFTEHDDTELLCSLMNNAYCKGFDDATRGKKLRW